MKPELNLYYFHRDARLCAMWLHDKHLVTQIREVGQMISTACQMVVCERDTVLYKPESLTPSASWILDSIEHATWAFSLWQAMLEQHESLFKRKTPAWEMNLRIKNNYLTHFPKVGWTDPPCVVPDDCLTSDTAMSYRKYYLKYRVHANSYKVVRRPWWVDDYLYGSDFKAADAGAVLAIERAEAVLG